MSYSTSATVDIINTHKDTGSSHTKQEMQEVKKCSRRETWRNIEMNDRSRNTGKERGEGRGKVTVR